MLQFATALIFRADRSFLTLPTSTICDAFLLRVGTKWGTVCAKSQDSIRTEAFLEAIQDSKAKVCTHLAVRRSSAFGSTTQLSVHNGSPIRCSKSWKRGCARRLSISGSPLMNTSPFE